MERPVFNFSAPKRKRVMANFETGPFPVPIETLTGVENSVRQWSYYQGRLSGNSVMVDSLPEMQALYQMGFFGKGNLSWSSPDYNIAVGKDRQMMRKRSDETFLRLMSRRRYMKHSEWRQHKGTSFACAVKNESADAKDTEDQIDRKEGTEDTKSAFLSSSSCSHSLPSCPQSSTSCPHCLSSYPHSSTSCPQVSSSCPQSMSSCPQASSSCPQSSTSCPHQASTSCPHASSSCPQSSSSCPHQALSSCPQASSSCPQSSTSCPHQALSSCPQASSSIEQLCLGSVDEDVDVLIMEDSEGDSDADGPASVAPKRQTAESVATDPFPLRENLQFGLEEAFFLSYGLGCLVVSNEDKGPMNLVEMWEKFRVLSPSFVSRYVVYHNFRSKGWVVKTGVKYGVDFVLYKKGLPFYHSSYSVVVVAVNEGSNYEEKGNFNWTSLCCTNRVTEQVSKELMFCYVIRPSDLSDEELRSPKSISKFKVSEFIVRRWISKKERENAEYLEMP